MPLVSVQISTLDGGKLAEAVFALNTTELRSGVPMPVSLHRRGNDPVSEGYYVRMPPDASELEVRFDTRRRQPRVEAGLWVTEREIEAHWVRHQDAHRILRDGVVTMTVRRPPGRWPAAWFILIRGAESGGNGTFDGTLVASVLRYGDGNRLRGGQRLLAGEFIQARAETCRLVFQPDGDLVASSNGVAYWSAGTRGAGGGSARMQADGNFVVYDEDGLSRWSTRTGGNRGAYLGIQNDCNVVLRTAGGAALWSSDRP